MYSIRHVTLAGSEYHLHSDRPLTRESAPSIGSFGATFATVDNETIVVRTSDRETCLAILRYDMDTKFDGQYHLGDALVSAGSYVVYGTLDGKAVRLGTHNVVLWEQGGQALWIESEAKTVEWLLDSLSSLKPAFAQGSVTLSGADERQLDDESHQSLLTLFGIGALQLSPIEQHPDQAGGSEAAAGRLFRSADARDPYIILRSGSVHSQLHLVETQLDAAVSFMKSSIRELSFTSDVGRTS